MNFNKIFDKLQPKVLFVLHFFFFFLNSFFSFPSSPLPFSHRMGQFTMHLHYKNSCNLIMNSRQWFTLVHWKILCLCIFSVQPSCILLNLPAFYWTLSWRILLSLKKFDDLLISLDNFCQVTGNNVVIWIISFLFFFF